MTDSSVPRRTVLGIGGMAAVAGLAGCVSSVTPPNGSSDDTAPSNPNDAESPYRAVYRDAIDSVLSINVDRGQGAGFIYDGEHAVTNAHVVGQSPRTEIRFNDGSWTTGEVVGTDPHADLAAIALADVPTGATPLPLIEGQAKVGQEVIAIGNPFNLRGSLTTGVVSGVNRSIPAPTGYRIPDAIQTDAAVNPGNSGGPLMSLTGRVVAIISSGGGDNIAFGISAALTQRVIPALIENGRFEHAWVGVSLAPVTPSIAEANNLDTPSGLLVVDVVDAGPANGILQPSEDERVVDGRRLPVGGDVLLAIDDKQLQTTEHLGSYLALQTSPGDTVTFRIRRNGSEQSVALELGTRP